MGGMSALGFEILFPGCRRFREHVVGMHSLPFSIALRSLQREIHPQGPGVERRQLSRDKVPLTGIRLRASSA